MKSKPKLSPKMTVPEFDVGYWFADELKEFGDRLGIPGAKRMRKDELEKAIKIFLKSGKVTGTSRPLAKTGTKDLDSGLTLKLPIVNYTSNKETKAFLHSEAKKLSPAIKRRSGAMYRLNRWREDQISRGAKITYGDLVAEYIRINESDEPFERIPHGRYINFLADYMKFEKNAKRENALKAWEQLKKMEIPKDYKSWRQCQTKNRAGA
jgi:SAP domain-containing new25